MLYYFILRSHFHINSVTHNVNSRKSTFKYECGWGNGYVLIPKGHKFYGLEYDDIDVNVHGGLTYSGIYLGWIEKYEEDGNDYELDINLKKKIDKNGYEFLMDYWVLGFDTAHYGDNLINCTKNYVLAQTKLLFDECLDVKYIRKLKLNKIKNGINTCKIM